MELTNRKSNGNGVHGRYFNLEDGTGVKLEGAVYDHEGHVSPEQCIKSYRWEKAQREVEMMKRLEITCFTPKFIKLEPVFYNGFYYPGIYMTHFEAKTLRECSIAMEESDKLMTAIKNRLARLGVRHKDMNYGNVMIGPNNEYYLVDMDPQYMDVSTMRRLYYQSRFVKAAVKVYNRILKFFKREELDYEFSKYD